MVEKDDAKPQKLECEYCHKEIPHSVAHSHEGPDYILHFCCEKCHDHYFKDHPPEEKRK